MHARTVEYRPDRVAQESSVHPTRCWFDSDVSSKQVLLVILHNLLQFEQGPKHAEYHTISSIWTGRCEKRFICTRDPYTRGQGPCSSSATACMVLQVKTGQNMQISISWRGQHDTVDPASTCLLSMSMPERVVQCSGSVTRPCRLHHCMKSTPQLRAQKWGLPAPAETILLPRGMTLQDRHFCRHLRSKAIT